MAVYIYIVRIAGDAAADVYGKRAGVPEYYVYVSV